MNWTKSGEAYSTFASDWIGLVMVHPVDGEEVMPGAFRPELSDEGEVLSWVGRVREVELVVFND